MRRRLFIFSGAKLFCESTGSGAVLYLFNMFVRRMKDTPFLSNIDTPSPYYRLRMNLIYEVLRDMWFQNCQAKVRLGEVDAADGYLRRAIMHQDRLSPGWHTIHPPSSVFAMYHKRHVPVTAHLPVETVSQHLFRCQSYSCLSNTHSNTN